MKYDAEYFLDKFDKIPAERWTDRFFSDSEGRMCALGHCNWDGFTNINSNQEARSLSLIMYRHLVHSVIAVNDGLIHDARLLGSTPKERIMNALLLINAGVRL